VGGGGGTSTWLQVLQWKAAICSLVMDSAFWATSSCACRPLITLSSLSCSSSSTRLEYLQGSMTLIFYDFESIWVGEVGLGRGGGENIGPPLASLSCSSLSSFRSVHLQISTTLNWMRFYVCVGGGGAHCLVQPLVLIVGHQIGVSAISAKSHVKMYAVLFLGFQ